MQGNRIPVLVDILHNPAVFALCTSNKYCFYMQDTIDKYGKCMYNLFVKRRKMF